VQDCGGLSDWLPQSSYRQKKYGTSSGDAGKFVIENVVSIEIAKEEY